MSRVSRWVGHSSGRLLTDGYVGHAPTAVDGRHATALSRLTDVGNPAVRRLPQLGVVCGGTGEEFARPRETDVSLVSYGHSTRVELCGGTKPTSFAEGV